MKKSCFSGIQIGKLICLLVTVGILCISQRVTAQASSYRDSNLTGQTDTSTTNRDSGTTETPEELQELNTGNQFSVTVNGGNGDLNGSLRILITLTMIALAPTLILMLTCFTRIIIVLHFTRAALNTQTAPPNQVLVGLALFLTFFIMAPTISQVYEEAVVPFDEGRLTQEEAFEVGIEPIREFMYAQTVTEDVRVFMDISKTEWNGELNSIPLTVLIPSFIVGELRMAFQIGFLIYIPFIVIDMVVASTLMSMGMMMLPPTTISMPFKILLFIMADGWNLIIVNLVKTFY